MPRVSHQSSMAAALLAIGLAFNPWTIGYVATEDGGIDQAEIVAAILFFDALCVLGALQLRAGWVASFLWGRRVGVPTATLVVGLVAGVMAGSYWGIALYNESHHHEEVVGAAHQQATPEQQQWAENFYRRSLAAALKNGWFDIDKALAQGFQADRVNRTHFPNLTYMFDDVILDPERPEWLVYDDSPNGKVLMALMFFPRTLEEVGPTPGGPLAQWHYHPFEHSRCAVQGLWTVGNTDRNGQCAEGIPVMRSPEMLHVWFIDHPLGRFTEMKIVPEYWQDDAFDVKRLHPIAVHFAIGLFVMAVLIDLAAFATGKQQYHWVGWVNLAIAVVAAYAAVAAGMTAEANLRPTHEAHQVLDLHRRLGFASLGLIVLLAAWRFRLRGGFPRRGAAALYIFVSLAGMGAISGAGYYGGEMVYEHGAGVRVIDRFTRERYWKLVNDVYRKSSAPLAAPPAHH
jgi:uncharacterized membrane protein